MTAPLRRAEEVFLVRHGQTAWSVSGQHTGVTDLPLTPEGRAAAKRLAPRLAGTDFALVLASPLERARVTCELAGLGARMQIEPDLAEWNYGSYEGLTPEQIHRTAPEWMIFRDGCPGGESPEDVGARVDRVIGKVRAAGGAVALFAHGHVSGCSSPAGSGCPRPTAPLPARHVHPERPRPLPGPSGDPVLERSDRG